MDKQKQNSIKKIITKLFPISSMSEFWLPLTIGLILAVSIFFILTKPEQYMEEAVAFFAVIMIIQGIFFLYVMLYAWEDEKLIKGNQIARSYSRNKFGITALVPARHEEKVIEDTIKAINNIDYPHDLKEIIVICRDDDQKTIKSVKRVIKNLHNKYIKLVIFNSLPINKPHSLNIGIKKASHNVIVVFDAEDQPHRQIYKNVNTVMQKEKADVVQFGVQLMDFRSSWFSLFNVLEYYFWFKSSLHFFANSGCVPLGGNSVFFKKHLLKNIGGWDEECLTEDADIGIRLSSSGAKVKIIYNEEHATQEETPHSLKSFIKQRTRWNQGFIQILLKGEWLKLPTLKQRIIAGYILLIPELQSLLFLIIPVSLITALTIKLPLIITILSILPMLLLLLQLTMLNVGLYEFTKAYKLRYPFWIVLITFIYFYPYQILLGLSAFRAVIRTIQGNTTWEKTIHTNAHREQLEFNPAIV